MSSSSEVTTSATTDPGRSTPPPRHHRIVVVGGGSGGIDTAARLRRKLKDPDLAIVEPSEDHYYQPLWTLVGAGVMPREKSRHGERGLIPDKATWIRDRVTEFAPQDNHVVLGSGGRLSYDYLIVAAGLQLDWGKVDGLEGNVGRNGICSNYLYDQCDKTWETLQAFTGGNALFTMPVPPIKCAGAPQKIMYLADDHFRKAGVRERSQVHYYAGTPGIFSVKEFAKTLNEVIARKHIQTHYKHNLIRVDADAKQATFQNLENDEETTVGYDMIHVCPPQGPPDFVKQSPIANEAGWVNVDKHTLQHPQYPNVFSLGDVSSLPTSKTGAAIRKEAPVLVENLLAQMNGKPLTASYDGYASCPLTTGYGKLVLAEFDYELKPAPSFPFDTTKERWSMYQFKRYGLPALYWQGMMKGLV
ncbi:MAG: NAD(P)/FAD-dependent oxidoreductase [Actinomycetota bacterium]|nr:NAD(P)/FAD-dependent oxidoreductase [Actinomycetota bacterium]